MSDRNNFLTSSRAWHGFDCRIKEATTFRITEKSKNFVGFVVISLQRIRSCNIKLFTVVISVAA
jgi:hypothetical protein